MARDGCGFPMKTNNKYSYDYDKLDSFPKPGEIWIGKSNSPYHLQKAGPVLVLDRRLAMNHRGLMIQFLLPNGEILEFEETSFSALMSRTDLGK